MSIQYKLGDLFELLPDDNEKVVVVPHVCNNLGMWGAGFVIPLGKKWPHTQRAYQAWHAVGTGREHPVQFALGEVQIVMAESPDPEANAVYVANMIGQDGVGGGRPLNYAALGQCMWKTRKRFARDASDPNLPGVEILCPLFGSGLAGGDWNIISTMIEDAWVRHDIPVTVCIHPSDEQKFGYLLKGSD